MVVILQAVVAAELTIQELAAQAELAVVAQETWVELQLALLLDYQILAAAVVAAVEMLRLLVLLVQLVVLEL
jgi:hypothetical protein